MSAQAFLYLVRLVRPGIFGPMSPQEEVVEEHFTYLKRKLDEERLIFAGPCLDGTFGVVVFEALSPEEAQQFMNNDPAIKKGLMTGEIHPFRVSLVKSLCAD
ncbi:MAG: YciI family protein [Candidatus Methanofastidiosia archaeon]